MNEESVSKFVVYYNHDLDPLHPQNRKVAKALDWTYDPDFHAYRDTCGFLMFNGDLPQNNNVDCHR